MTGSGTGVAQKIVESCDASPPKDVPDHPEMFSDLEDDRVSSALYKLWQKGILDAEWDEEDQATRWGLTHFGVELCERNLVRPYVEALENEIQIDASPTLLEAER